MDMKIRASCILKSAACAIALFAWSAFGLMFPLQKFTPENYRDWRDSMKMAVYADAENGLVQFAVQIPKPTLPTNEYWSLTLRINDSQTNTIAQTQLGDTVFSREISRELAAFPGLTNSTVQSFRFALKPDLVTNSIVWLDTRILPETLNSIAMDPGGGPRFEVRLLDIYSNAISSRATSSGKSK